MLQIAFTSFEEFGLVGAVIGFILLTFSGLMWWVVRGMRADAQAALAQAKEATTAHLLYVANQAQRQTEVLVAVANRMDRLEERNRAEEKRVAAAAIVTRDAIVSAVDRQTRTLGDMFRDTVQTVLEATRNKET